MAAASASDAFTAGRDVPSNDTTSRQRSGTSSAARLSSPGAISAGPAARSERRVPLLVLGEPCGTGTAVAVTAERMQPLGDLARQIAEAGGGLGFRTRQVDGVVQFEVFQPADVSASVRFGFGLGNARYIGIETKAPT